MPKFGLHGSFEVSRKAVDHFSISIARARNSTISNGPRLQMIETPEVTFLMASGVLYEIKLSYLVKKAYALSEKAIIALQRVPRALTFPLQ